MEVGDARLPRDRFRQQGLPGSGHADEEYALRNPGSHPGELLGALQESDDFLQFVLGFFLSGHVGEAHLLSGFKIALGLALAELEGLVPRALGLTEHHPDEGESYHPGKEFQQYPERRHAGNGTRYLDAFFAQDGEQLGILVRNHGSEISGVPARTLERTFYHIAVEYLDGIHFSPVQIGGEGRIRYFLGLGAGVAAHEIGGEKSGDYKKENKGEAVRRAGIERRARRFIILVVRHFSPETII